MTFDDYYMACAGHVLNHRTFDPAHAHAILLLNGRHMLAQRAWDFLHHPSVPTAYRGDSEARPVTQLALWWAFVSSHWDDPEPANA